MDRATAFGVVVLGTLLVAAGCVAPEAEGSLSGPNAPADPASDVLGWEGGYWYNETLAVTHADGLNETERRAVVRRAMARVEHLRRIEFEEPVPVEIESRESFRNRVEGGDDDDETSPRRILIDATYESLFLVGEDRSGSDAESSTTATTVIGFYVPGEDRIVLVSDSATPQVREWVLGHELVHAIQFRTFDMGFNGSTRDAWNARNAVVEGDARLVDYRYRQRCGDEWRCLTPTDTGGGGGGSGAHPGISLYQYFPYSDGPAYVRSVYRHGGWPAVNALYEDLPTSTAGVILPGRNGVAGDETVTVADRSTETWTRVEPEESLGMPGITSMFAYTTYDSFNESVVIDRTAFLPPTAGSLDPIEYGIPAAVGWRGDRLVAYHNGDQRAYVWRLRWDNASEAREFLTGYREMLRHWGARRIDDERWRIDSGPFADAFRIVVDGDTVTITNAPSLASLDAVHGD